MCNVRFAQGFLDVRTALNITLALMLLASGNTQAIEPKPGQIYSGGTEISVAALGIRFRIPNGWRGALAPSAESFLMESPNGRATLFAVADSISAAEALTVLQGPIPLTDQVQLILQGQVEGDAEQMKARYSVSNNPQLAAVAKARTGSNGTSVAFFLVAISSELAASRPHLEETFDSLAMASSATASTASNTESGVVNGNVSGNDSWAAYLKGKHIVRFFTASGYTEEQHIWLCSDGRFLRRFDSGGFGGGTPGASGAFQGNYSGRWEATGQGEFGQLFLHFKDNNVSRYNLRWDYQKNQLFVDDKRWLHDKNGVCQ